MGGNNSSTTDQKQNQFTNSTNTGSTAGTTNPWLPTLPYLQNILQQIGGGGGSVSPDQAAALRSLQSGAGAVPNFGAAGTDVANTMLSGGQDVSPQVGILGDAYRRFADTQSPYLQPGYTNPMTAPGIGTALKTVNQDITNQIEGQWAAAGRDPVGNAGAPQALARGLAAGEAPILTNEYNTLVGQQQGAANSLLSGAGSTASGITNLQQIPLQNAMTGFGAANAVPGLYTAPGTGMLNAADIGQGLPYENLMRQYQMLMGLGGAGSSTTGNMTGTSQGTTFGTGTSTTSQPVNPWTTAAGIGLGAAALFSDERLKEDIEPIGMLFNKLPLYRYRFKDDPTRQLHTGVMAQEVEKVAPEAIEHVGGYKAVDYDIATNPIGLWRPAAMAA